MAPNPPGEEGGGLLVERLPLSCWVNGSGASPWGGVSSWGRRREAAKPTGCPTYPRSHPLERNTHSFPPMLGMMTLGRLLPPDLPHLSAPGLPFSFLWGSSPEVGAGHPADPTPPEYDGKTEQRSCPFRWRRADPGALALHLSA